MTKNSRSQTILESLDLQDTADGISTTTHPPIGTSQTGSAQSIWGNLGGDGSKNPTTASLKAKAKKNSRLTSYI